MLGEDEKSEELSENAGQKVEVKMLRDQRCLDLILYFMIYFLIFIEK
jgi:hypothetical protein